MLLSEIVVADESSATVPASSVTALVVPSPTSSSAKVNEPNKIKTTKIPTRKTTPRRIKDEGDNLFKSTFYFFETETIEIAKVKFFPASG